MTVTEALTIQRDEARAERDDARSEADALRVERGMTARLAKLRSAAAVDAATITRLRAKGEAMVAALERIEDRHNWGEDGGWSGDSYPNEIAEGALNVWRTP